MENKDTLSEFFNRVIEGLKTDAQAKGQKIPVSSFRHEETNEGGQMFGADYFKYLVYGRGPGKMPPLDNIIEWAEKNIKNATRENKDGTFSTIPYASLAFAIGTKIAKEGTDIYTGKKQGIDFLGVMEKNMPDLLKALARNEALNIATSLKQSIQ